MCLWRDYLSSVGRWICWTEELSQCKDLNGCVGRPTAYAIRSPFASDERIVGCPRCVVGEAAQIASAGIVSLRWVELKMFVRDLIDISFAKGFKSKERFEGLLTWSSFITSSRCLNVGLRQIASALSLLILRTLFLFYSAHIVFL